MRGRISGMSAKAASYWAARAVRRALKASSFLSWEVPRAARVSGMLYLRPGSTTPETVPEPFLE